MNVSGNRTEAKRNLRKSCDVEIRAGVAEPGQRRRAVRMRDSFRSLSRRGSWVRIPPPALKRNPTHTESLKFCARIGNKIRALYGHTIPVKLELEEDKVVKILARACARAQQGCSEEDVRTIVEMLRRRLPEIVEKVEKEMGR